MIEEARRLRAGGSCAFEVGRAEALDFPDASFDVIVSSLAVHHIPEERRAAAYAETHRVLKPGGRALIADFRPPRARLGRRLVGVVTGPTTRDNPVDRIAPMPTAAGFVRPSVHQVGLFVHCVRADKAAA